MSGDLQRIRGRVALGVLVLGMGVLAWHFWTAGPERGEEAAAGPVEVSSAELVYADGRWHLPGGVERFTGVLVTHYADGSVESRSEVVDGLLHGVSEGWHRGGGIQVREQYHEGTSHGLRTKWHANGNKLSEAMIARGEFHGTFRRWHENGALAERVEMRGNQADGIAVSYYPSAYLKARVTLSAGAVLAQEYWQDGEQREGSGRSQE